MDAGPSIAERAYASIRANLLAGIYRPGERLDAAIVAREHGASITPIREAMNKLAGERLLEMQTHQGFKVPLLTEGELRALYDWTCQQLIAGLRLAPKTRLARVEDGLWPSAAMFERDMIAATERVCLGIAQLSGNTRCYLAIEQANAELRLVRRFEPLMIAPGSEDLRGFAWSLARSGLDGAETMLEDYHRARRDVAADIAGLLTMAAHHGFPPGGMDEVESSGVVLAFAEPDEVAT